MVSKLVGAIFLVTLVVAFVTADYDKVDKPSRRLFDVSFKYVGAK